MTLSRIVARGFQSYWRLSRGLSLGAEVFLTDASGRLLLRSDAGGYWRLPGTTVTSGEGAQAAAHRALRALGLGDVSAPDALFWLFVDPKPLPWDVVATFRLQLTRADPASPHQAGEGLDFFAPDGLPAAVEPATMVRLRALIEGRAPFEVC